MKQPTRRTSDSSRPSEAASQPTSPDRGTKSNALSPISRILVFPLILLVKLYRYCVSPMFPAVCRFTPTCSEYALEALRRHGPLKGTWLAIRRISRCHPWGGSGYDPVP